MTISVYKPDLQRLSSMIDIYCEQQTGKQHFIIRSSWIYLS